MREWCGLKSFAGRWLDPRMWFTGVRYSGHIFDYERREIHHGVTVEIMKCAKCGKVDISWR